MRYSIINIRGFRGLKSILLDDIGNINLFVGKNNSGKTSLLEAIFLVTGVSNPQLALSVDGFRKLLHTDTDDFRFVFHKLDYRSQLKIEAELSDPLQIRSLVVKPILGLGKGNVMYSETVESNEPLIDTASEIGKSIGLSFGFKIKERHKQEMAYESQLLFDFEIKTLKTKPPKNYTEKLFGIYLSPYLSMQNLNQRLEDLIIAKKKKEIIEILNIIDKNIVDIVVGRNNMIWVDIGLPKLIPLNIMGDGIIKTLELLSAIDQAKNGMIFIDEIENGFHYSTLKKLWSKILVSAQHNNVQIFSTTHSYEVVKSLRDVLLEKKYSEFQNETRVYNIIKTEDKNSAVKYSFDQIDHAISQENELR